MANHSTRHSLLRLRLRLRLRGYARAFWGAAGCAFALHVAAQGGEAPATAPSPTPLTAPDVVPPPSQAAPPIPAAPPAPAASAAGAAASAPARKAARKPASSAAGPAWSSLNAAQRAALRPLQRDWAGIDAARKQKWLEIAQRFGKLSPQEQRRLHTRMAEWARLSPEQRTTARLTFQEAQLLPPEVRQDRWEAYLALPEAERLQFAEQLARPPDNEAHAATRRGNMPRPSQAKSNIVPNPLHTAMPHPVAPTILRAGLGATTIALRQPTQPLWHQQVGLPKIAATPEFVDPKTLAPRVGPQALGIAHLDSERRP